MNRSSPANSLMNEAGIAASLHRQRSELQGGDPAFGPGFEHVDVRRRSGSGSMAPFKYSAASSAVKRRSAARTSSRAPFGSQRGEGERGIGAGDDHQAELRREVLEQERHGVVDLGGGDDVVVVEHQDDVLRRGLEIVDQCRDDGLQRCRPAPEQGGQCLRLSSGSPLRVQRGRRSRTAPGRRLARRGTARRWCAHWRTSRPRGWSCRNRRAPRPGSAQGAHAVGQVAAGEVGPRGCDAGAAGAASWAAARFSAPVTRRPRSSSWSCDVVQRGCELRSPGRLRRLRTSTG